MPIPTATVNAGIEQTRQRIMDELRQRISSLDDSDLTYDEYTRRRQIFTEQTAAQIRQLQSVAIGAVENASDYSMNNVGLTDIWQSMEAQAPRPMNRLPPAPLFAIGDRTNVAASFAYAGASVTISGMQYEGGRWVYNIAEASSVTFAENNLVPINRATRVAARIAERKKFMVPRPKFAAFTQREREIRGEVKTPNNKSKSYWMSALSTIT